MARPRIRHDDGTKYYVPITLTVNGVVLALNNPYDDTLNGYIDASGDHGSFQIDDYAETEVYNGQTYNYSYAPQATKHRNGGRGLLHELGPVLPHAAGVLAGARADVRRIRRDARRCIGEIRWTSSEVHRTTR